MLYILYALTGITAGIFAGLLGIGGGVIVVPLLNLIFQFNQFPPHLIMHMAVGTSLAVMIFTSISSAYAYNRKNLVIWNLFYKLTPGLITGTITGSIIAAHLSSKMLRIAFAIFLIITAIHMFFSKETKQKIAIPGLVTLTITGFIIGILSGFFGVGGGFIMVPFFIFCNVEMHKAAGTSAICGLPLAIAGTLSFITTGWSVTPHLLPTGTTGYVYWPAVFLIGFASVLFAPLGTRISTHISNKLLKKIFLIVLLLVALQMLLP